MPQPEALALPHKSIDGGAEAAAPAGSDPVDPGLIAADAQIEPGDPAAYRRAQHLIEHDAATLILMCDGKETAVRQHTDRKPGRVGDAMQAEIAIARCRADAGAASSHLLSTERHWRKLR